MKCYAPHQLLHACEDPVTERGEFHPFHHCKCGAEWRHDNGQITKHGFHTGPVTGIEDTSELCNPRMDLYLASLPAAAVRRRAS